MGSGYSIIQHALQAPSLYLIRFPLHSIHLFLQSEFAMADTFFFRADARRFPASFDKEHEIRDHGSTQRHGLQQVIQEAFSPYTVVYWRPYKLLLIVTRPASRLI